MKVMINVDGVVFEMPDNLTYGEMRTFKRVSGGIPAGQLQERLEAGDSDAVLGICAIGLDRHHGLETGTTSVDYLLGLSESQVTIEFVAEPGDDDAAEDDAEDAEGNAEAAEAEGTEAAS